MVYVLVNLYQLYNQPIFLYTFFILIYAPVKFSRLYRGIISKTQHAWLGSNYSASQARTDMMLLHIVGVVNEYIAMYLVIYLWIYCDAYVLLFWANLTCMRTAISLFHSFISSVQIHVRWYTTSYTSWLDVMKLQEKQHMQKRLLKGEKKEEEEFSGQTYMI